jgi:hypothetical protein
MKAQSSISIDCPACGVGIELPTTLTDNLAPADRKGYVTVGIRVDKHALCEHFASHKAAA